MLRCTASTHKYKLSNSVRFKCTNINCWTDERTFYDFAVFPLTYFSFCEVSIHSWVISQSMWHNFVAAMFLIYWTTKSIFYAFYSMCFIFLFKENWALFIKSMFPLFLWLPEIIVLDPNISMSLTNIKNICLSVVLLHDFKRNLVFGTHFIANHYFTLIGPFEGSPRS